MGIVALLLVGASIVCAVMSMRGLAVLLFGTAAAFWLVPNIGGSGGGMPGDFAMASELRPAPTTEFRTPTGKRLTLADFRGRVVLLNIWATWCGPCRAEMPSLDRLQAMHKGDGLAVIALSVDRDGGGAVRRFFQQSGIRSLSPYLDANGAIASAVRARSIPTTVLIDRDGNVVGSLVGAIRWDSPDALVLIRRYLETPPAG
jgi:thiol-disulfide isomerase/thioredoxin